MSQIQQLTQFGYAFDVVGVLFFGRMFGFMDGRSDYQSYIASLDSLMPPMCIAECAATYARPFVLGSTILIPSMRKTLKALSNIAEAARTSVDQRSRELQTGQEQRSDILQQLFDIQTEKGEKVDFGIPEIRQEVYGAM